MWMILGAIIIKIYSLTTQKLKAIIRQRRIEKNSLKFIQDSIVSLDHGDPFYKPENIIFNNSNRSQFIEIPEEYVTKIKNIRLDFEFSKNQTEIDIDIFNLAIDNTGICNLRELIEKHSKIVAEKFIEKLNCGLLIFNGEKYGISKICVDRRGINEESRLFIDYYRTDYFTHQVFRSIYRELKEMGHEISKVKSISELNKYFPFLTSFGVNTILTLDSSGIEEIVLAKRSRNISNMIDKDLWHVTMNEGLSITDLDADEVSLVKCLHRGLREELGIREEFHKEIMSKNFYDLFINMDDFEIGISSIVKTTMTFDILETLYKSAQDAELETLGLIKLKAEKTSIKKFFENNDTTKACTYLIQMYSARKKGFF